jgi:hypothetical protein
MPNGPNATQIPAIRVPFIDPRTGLISREWYRYLFNQYNAVSENDSDAAISELQLTPSNSVFTSDVDDIMKRLYALDVAPINNPQVDLKRYGAFYDSTDQTAAAINTAYAMTFNNTQFSKGVTIGTPTSRVYVDRAHIYNIQFSAQLDKSSASKSNVWIWLDKNGTSIPDSATQVSLQGSSSAIVAAWNFLLDMNAGDYFRLMWSTDDTGCFLKHDVAAPPVPAIPSVILTVTNNINE